MKKIIIIIIVALGLVFSGILIDRYLLSNPIEIESIQVEDTQWKDKYLQLKQKIESGQELNDDDNILAYKCLTNPLSVTGHTEGNFLFVDVTDGCKSTKAKFNIRAKQTKYHIIQIGVAYQYKIGFLYEISYLYDFGIIAVGGGVIVNKEYPGLKFLAQIKI